jgi:hypothetical protein
VVLKSYSRRNVHRLTAQLLEDRSLLSAVGFAAHEIARSDVHRPLSVYAADLDGDGDADILSASFYDGKIAWYENTSGSGTCGEQRVISVQTRPFSSRIYNAYAVSAGDFDGDGDVDVLAAAGRITWYMNIDGHGSFREQQQIKESGSEFVHVADMDGDGDLDVLAKGGYGNDVGLSWFENTDGRGDFAARHTVETWGQVRGNLISGYPSAYTADFDGDGDQDVISSTPYQTNGDSGRTAWHENVDGQGTFGPSKTIVQGGGETVFAADLDGDGDMDAITSARLPRQNFGDVDKKMSWLENIDGRGKFVERIVATYATSHSLTAADFDGDGDIDILAASGTIRQEDISWYENSDSPGRFVERHVITTNAHGRGALFTADIDGDGDIDALSASYFDEKIAWYENSDGAGTFGPQQIIVTTVSFAESVGTADFDGGSHLWRMSMATVMRM